MMSSIGHISFDPKSLAEVNRVIVLRVNTDEMQVETLLDATVVHAVALRTPEGDGKRALPLTRADSGAK
jgi:hypothetical protein